LSVEIEIAKIELPTNKLGLKLLDDHYGGRLRAKKHSSFKHHGDDAHESGDDGDLCVF